MSQDEAREIRDALVGKSLGLYILSARKRAVQCNDVLKWAEWKHDHWKDWIVAKDKVAGVEVSTVFIGMELNVMRALGMRGRPQLFETMVFGKSVLYQQRYSTWSEAASGHKRVCDLFRPVVKANAKTRVQGS